MNLVCDGTGGLCFLRHGDRLETRDGLAVW